MSHALANPAHQPRQMDQVRALTKSFPPQNASVAVNQLRRDAECSAAQRNDSATTTSSAAAKGKWAAQKGFAMRSCIPVDMRRHGAAIHRFPTHAARGAAGRRCTRAAPSPLCKSARHEP